MQSLQHSHLKQRQQTEKNIYDGCVSPCDFAVRHEAAVVAAHDEASPADVAWPPHVSRDRFSTSAVPCFLTRASLAAAAAASCSSPVDAPQSGGSEESISYQNNDWQPTQGPVVSVNTSRDTFKPFLSAQFLGRRHKQRGSGQAEWAELSHNITLRLSHQTSNNSPSSSHITQTETAPPGKRQEPGALRTRRGSSQTTESRFVVGGGRHIIMAVVQGESPGKGSCRTTHRLRRQ